MNKKTYCRKCGKKPIKIFFDMWLFWIIFRAKGCKPLCTKCYWDEVEIE
jgi:hypothetical protein